MPKQYPVLPAPPHYTPVVETANDDGIIIDVIDEDEDRTRVEEITVVSGMSQAYAFEVEVLLNCGHMTLDQVVDILKRSPPKVSPSR